MKFTKKEYSSTFFLIFFASLCIGQSPSIKWQRCLGGTNIDGLSKGLVSVDSGFVLCGATRSNDGTVSGNHLGNCVPFDCGDGWFVKLDSLSNTTSQKCLGGTNEDGFEDMLIMNNGHILLWGMTMSNDGDVSGNHNSGTSDGWLVEVDSSGNIIRQRCFGGTDNDILIDVKITNNSDYIVLGVAVSNNGDVSGNHGSGDIWIVKLDSSWNIQWQKCIGGTGDEVGYDIFIRNNGGFTIVGWSDSQNGDISSPIGGIDYWIFQIDSIGNKIWDRSYGGTLNDASRHACISSDGGFIITGNTDSHDGDVSGHHDTISTVNDIWLIKVDSSGNLIWQKCLGGVRNEVGYDITADVDSGYIISGSTNSSDGDVHGTHFGGMGCVPFACDDAWLVKVDSAGSLQWQKCLGGTDGETGDGITLFTGEEYLLLGSTFSSDGDVSGNINYGNSDAWIVRLSYIAQDAVLLGIVYPDNSTICENSISPVIQMKNNGFNILSSITINYQIDTGVINNFIWTGLLPQDSILEVTLPAVGVPVGAHLLSVVLTNPNGGIDQNLSNDSLSQNFVVVAATFYPPVIEGFEGAGFPPSDWLLFDTYSIGDRTTNASGFGNSSACFKADFFNTIGYADLFLVTHEFDLSSLIPPIKFSYSIASAMKDTSSSQALFLSYSTSCTPPFLGMGFSWFDNDLSTVSNVSSDFTPLPNQWRSDTVDISTFVSGHNHVRIAFELYTENSNNLFIDDINIFDAIMNVSHEIVPELDIYCYWDETSNNLLTTLISKTSSRVSVEILDITGRILFDKKVDLSIGENRRTFNLGELNSGIYLIRLLEPYQELTRKFIIQ